VLADEEFLEAEQAGAQAFGGVSVVMEMDLDLAEARPAQLRQGVKIFSFVFFDREEKSVARRAAVGIAKAAELPREALRPRLHAPPARSDVGAPRLRLVMVGDAQDAVDFLGERRRAKASAFPEIR